MTMNLIIVTIFLSFQSSSLNESAQSGTGTSPSSESTHEVSEIAPPMRRFTRIRKVPDRYREWTG